MSHDGKWCATAMPGGSEQKLLLFKTDETPIPASMLAKSYITGELGYHADGSAFPNAACVVSLGGESGSGNTLNTFQRYLNTDSLMFVKGGLIFLNETNLDEVWGISLEDGALTSRNLNSGRASVNGAGIGSFISASGTTGSGQLTPATWARRM